MASTGLKGMLGLAVATVMAVAASAAELPPPRDRWIALETTHFTLYSDAGKRLARRVADDLETLHATLARSVQSAPRSPLPTHVYVFANHARFAPYNLRYRGRPAATAGYFTATEDGNYIAIDAGSRLDASAIVYHEYLHYFASSNLRGLPLWFEEGLGQLYQSFRVAGDEVQLGFPEPGLLNRLATSRMIPLAELVLVGRHSPLYNEGDRRSIFYAESWALVHYLLLDSDQRRSETQEFVARVTSGVPQVDALAASFNGGLVALQEELEQYVQRSIFRYVELPAPPLPSLQATVRPLSRAEVLLRLGDLLAHQEGRMDEAVAHFRAALAEEPHNALVLAALGMAAESRADWDEAAHDYARAGAAAPEDPRIQYLLGAFLLARGSDLEAATRALDRSVQLAPDFGPAWAALARAHLAAGHDLERALSAAEAAHRLLPARTDVTRMLLQLYLRTGRRAQAVNLVEHWLAGEPEFQAQARAMIVGADLREGNELAARGRLVEAGQSAALAEGTVAGAAGEAGLRRRIADLRSEILRRRTSRAYNAAVSAYNRGDLEEARRILEAVEPELREGGPGDDIRSLRSLLEHPEAPPPPSIELFTGVSREEMAHLNGLLDRGDLAGAAAWLEELRSRAPSSEWAWIDAKRREIARALAYNLAVDGYNRAVDQFNAAAYAAAISTLEGLLDSRPPASIAGDARALLDEARAAMTSGGEQRQ